MAGRHAAVEPKVKWATAAAYLTSSGLLGVLGAVEDNARILEPLPDPVSALALALVPGLLTFAAGWKARHAPRPEGG
ncbi:holin [Streptomyces collinus]